MSEFGSFSLMDGIAAITRTTVIPSTIRFSVPTSASQFRRSKNLPFHRKPPKFIVFASKDDPKLDSWDQMELKFGQLLGEDPKLTLAKIMGRKSNPDMSYLEVEKLYQKRSKVANGEIKEVPFVGAEEGQPSDSPSELSLLRPVPKKGVKIEPDKRQIESKIRKPSQPAPKKVDNSGAGVPNVILRKPKMFNEDSVETEKSSRFSIKPNLSLRMGREQPKERFSDISLLKKPEPINAKLTKEKHEEISGSVKAKGSNNIEENGLKSVFVSTETAEDVTLLQKPEMMNISLIAGPEHESSEVSTRLISGNDANLSSSNANLSTEMVIGTKINPDQSMESGHVSLLKNFAQDNATGLQPLEPSDLGSVEKSSTVNDVPETTLADSNSRISRKAALQGKPKRLDRSIIGTSNISREEMISGSPEKYGIAFELEKFLAASPVKEHEDTDWRRAEDLNKTGEREEVELLSSSTRGFVVSFGSLIGFLPYRNLSAKWKFLAFESWLRRKGLDPSKFKQNLGVIGSYEATSKITSFDPSLDLQTDGKVEGEVLPDMKLEDLLRIYDQEKLEFLSSFVGQKIKVGVILADRKSRRLIFSVKPKEKEELIEKKRSLMAKLNIGDVVKCCIKKITYFGIFVEVEGVPALIHQTEVSWDATLDPASYFKIGQIVEAKVHQLDFSLERIFLSLKEITPDPLTEALEAVVGGHESLYGEGRLEAAQADTEWVDVDLLIKELQQFEGIQSVSKGRFFLSPGLAPTFQVYMASMFENQYKLLARSGNRIQEVIVETSLGKEEMKRAILNCTNRVQ